MLPIGIPEECVRARTLTAQGKNAAPSPGPAGTLHYNRAGQAGPSTANQGLAGKAQAGRQRAPAYTPTNCPAGNEFPIVELGNDKRADLKEIQQILNYILPQLSKSQLLYLQKKCEFCKRIAKNMREPFCIIKGILFQKSWNKI